MSSISLPLYKTSRRWHCASFGHRHWPPASELRHVGWWRERRGRDPHGRGQSALHFPDRTNRHGPTALAAALFDSIGHEHACCRLHRHGKSNSVTRRDRRSAANGESVPQPDLTRVLKTLVAIKSILLR